MKIRPLIIAVLLAASIAATSVDATLASTPEGTLRPAELAVSQVAARSASHNHGRSITAVDGETIHLRGKAPSAAVGRVVLQQRDRGTWHNRRSARTTPNGRYDFRIRAHHPSILRVAAKPNTNNPAVKPWTSPLTRIRIATQQGHLTAPQKGNAGTRLILHASFTPPRARRPVVLQQRTSAGWREASTGVEDDQGLVAFAVTLDACPTTETFRAVATSSHGMPAISTPPAAIAVQGPSAAATCPPSEPARTPWVTGYYAGWFWDWLYPPDQVDMSAMTHFVFGRVAPGGGSLGGAPATIQPGAGSAHEPGSAPDGQKSVEDYLIDKAHAAGTKALLMLGGDGADGQGFMLSTSDARRPQFVKALVDYLAAHNYDGVDLDWENCLDGGAGCGETNPSQPVPATEARRRLKALISDIRAETATRARYQNTPALLTFPGYAVSINELNNGRVAQWQADVANSVDQYNLMSYGVGTTFNGAGWDSWFSGALAGATGSHPIDITSSVNAYVATGVARNRIGIGIGFFGNYFGPDITGPRQLTDDNDIWETDDVALSYSELDRMGYLSHGTQHFDSEAQSTYRTYESFGSSGYVPPADPGLPPRQPAGFLTYEDEQSIAAKARYVYGTGAGGTILWTINYGWLPRSGTNPLLEAVKTDFLER